MYFNKTDQHFDQGNFLRRVTWITCHSVTYHHTLWLLIDYLDQQISLTRWGGIGLAILCPACIVVYDMPAFNESIYISCHQESVLIIRSHYNATSWKKANKKCNIKWLVIQNDLYTVRNYCICVWYYILYFVVKRVDGLYFYSWHMGCRHWLLGQCPLAYWSYS